MRRKKLSVKCLYIWKIRLTAFMALWCFLCGAIAVFSLLIAFVIISIGIVLYIFTFFFYFPHLYLSCSYTVGKNSVSIRKGLFLHKRIYIDKSRILYSEMLQTPLQRIFKTCTVAYQAAGSVVRLSQIDIKDADGVMFK